ncbi:UDP-glycosyltransferase 88B1 [Dichanthelium oligosanthes]|uniref:UDP-glycosyltransferase 88B1 n=1 Tax=Dichanthelium oligosanthes TaxID=888268 RepID=A0A1E5WCX4_9POAL|nr:UDP-glycosyltransferase 88B1 [Dichanthelium oligosanthes]
MPGATAATHKTVVLYPSLGMGHLNPVVELAKVFLRRGVAAVIIAVVEVDSSDTTTTDRLAAANPGITFRRLLLLPDAAAVPPRGLLQDDGRRHSHPIMRTIDVLRAANPVLRDLLCELVIDMFCTDALDVAAELGVPAYFFFTSALGDLAVMLHLPCVFPDARSSFKDMPYTALRFPGVPPIRGMDMATTMQDRESDIARACLHQCARMPEARGFLVNTFDWLEALRSGSCMPAGRPTPPVYCIGPLIVPGNPGGHNERHVCLTWLDAQPNRSVVFLSFGSMGVLICWPL